MAALSAAAAVAAGAEGPCEALPQAVPMGGRAVRKRPAAGADLRADLAGAAPRPVAKRPSGRYKPGSRDRRGEREKERQAIRQAALAEAGSVPWCRKGCGGLGAWWTGGGKDRGG